MNQTLLQLLLRMNLNKDGIPYQGRQLFSILQFTNIILKFLREIEYKNCIEFKNKIEYSHRKSKVSHVKNIVSLFSPSYYEILVQSFIHIIIHAYNIRSSTFGTFS